MRAANVTDKFAIEIQREDANVYQRTGKKKKSIESILFLPDRRHEATSNIEVKFAVLKIRDNVEAS